MKDKIGQNIEIGDIVVYVSSNDLHKSRVKRFTAKMIGLEDGVLKFGYQIVVINEIMENRPELFL